VTDRAKPSATAASAAVPPCDSTWRATTAARGSSAATPPRKPLTCPVAPSGGAAENTVLVTEEIVEQALTVTPRARAAPRRNRETLFRTFANPSSKGGQPSRSGPRRISSNPCYNRLRPERQPCGPRRPVRKANHCAIDPPRPPRPLAAGTRHAGARGRLHLSAARRDRADHAGRAEAGPHHPARRH